jgi:hypothetical protein
MSLAPKTIYLAQRTDEGTAWQEKYITGSNLIIITDVTGSVVGSNTIPEGTLVYSSSFASVAANVEFSGIGNKPTLISSSAQVDYNEIENLDADRGDVIATETGSQWTVVGVNNVKMAELGTGLVKNETGSGEPSIALASVDYTPAMASILVNDSRYLTPLWEWSGSVRLSDPSAPPGQSTDLQWSPDGDFLAISYRWAPYISVYEKVGETLTKLSNLPNQPTAHTDKVSWSANGKLLTVTYNASPYLKVYRRENDKTFTLINNPTDMLSGRIIESRFSKNGEYLVLGSDSSPYIAIYRVDFEKFIRLSTPNSIPTTTVSNVDWSYDGKLLFVSQGSAATSFIIYQRQGDLFSKISNPPNLPITTNGGSFSPDGKYLSLAISESPRIQNYSIDKNLNFVKLTQPSLLPTNFTYKTSWHPSGKYVSIFQNSSPYVTIYLVSGTTFTKQVFSTGASTNVESGQWSPDGQFFSTTGYNPPRLSWYRTSANSPSGAPILMGRETLNTIATSSYAQTASYSIYSGVSGVSNDVDYSDVSGITSTSTFVGTSSYATNAESVITNANLTGHVTSTGNDAVLGSFTVAQLSTALSDATLSGNNTGDQTDITGTSSYASYVEYANVGNKPTLISGSAQIVSGLVGQKVSVTELTASNILVTNLHVTNVTSSVVYSSGSNTFGSVLTNKHEFTGSVNITGSISTTKFKAVDNQAGSMIQLANDSGSFVTSLITRMGSSRWTYTDPATKQVDLILKYDPTVESSSYVSLRIGGASVSEKLRFTENGISWNGDSFGKTFSLAMQSYNSGNPKTATFQDASGTVAYTSDITFSNLTGKPTLVSSSAQVDYNSIQNKPITIATASYVILAQTASYVEYSNISGVTNTSTFAGTSSYATKAASTITNANLTGHVTSVGNAAVLGSFTVAQLNTAISDATLSGSNTGDQTTITGNAGTATILQTTRTIGGSNFNGSANVTSFPVPGAIGATTPSTGKFTTLTATGIITGSNLSGINTGDQTDITGTSSYASYVEYTNVGNKPTLVSASAQIDYNSIQNQPSTVTRASLGIDTTDDVTFGKTFQVGSGSTSNSGWIMGYGAVDGYSGMWRTAETSLTINNASYLTGPAVTWIRALAGSQMTFKNGVADIMTLTDSAVTVYQPINVTGAITGSNLSGTNTGDQTDITGTASYASYVEYANVGNKPTLISGSAQIVSGLVGQKVSVTELTASNILVTNLHVTNVTSSVVYSSGSNIFGSVSTNTHQFTGSVNITGSLSVVGTIAGTSSYATIAQTASFAQTASYISPSYQPFQARKGNGQIISNGGTSARRISILAGERGTLAESSVITVVVENYEFGATDPSGTHIVWSAQSTDTSGDGYTNSISCQLTTAGDMFVNVFGSPNTNKRAYKYTDIRTDYASKSGRLTFTLTANATNPVITFGGKDISNGFVLTESGTPPDWLNPSLVTTYLIQSGIAPFGRQPIVTWIVGEVSDSDYLYKDTYGVWPKWITQGGAAAELISDRSRNSTFTAGATDWTTLGGASISSIGEVVFSSASDTVKLSLSNFTSIPSNKILLISVTVTNWSSSGGSDYVPLFFDGVGAGGFGMIDISNVYTGYNGTKAFKINGNGTFVGYILSKTGLTVGNTIKFGILGTGAPSFTITDFSLTQIGAVSLLAPTPNGIIDVTDIGGNDATLVGMSYNGNDPKVEDLIAGAGAITASVLISGSITLDGGNIDIDNNAKLTMGGVQLVSGDSGLNNFFGGTAGNFTMTGTHNFAVGQNALSSNTTGGNNTAIDESALRDNTTAWNNIAVGVRALERTTTGGSNTALGRDALWLNTTGTFNVAISQQALYVNTIGARNVAIGFAALYSNSSGSYNIGIGNSAGHSGTTGNGNISMGYQSLYDNTTGQYNTILGYNTGRGILSGSYNTIIGDNITGLAAGLSNNIILGSSGSIKAQHDGSSWTLTGDTSVVGAISGSNLSGTNTGDQTTITGNAGTATILQTTRTIGGSNFNGSANVTSFPSPGAIGATAPSTGKFTTVTATGTTGFTGTAATTQIENTFATTGILRLEHNGGANKTFLEISRDTTRPFTTLDFTTDTNGIGLLELGSGSAAFLAASSPVKYFSLNPTYNQTTGNDDLSDLFINRTETSIGSGLQSLIRTQVGGVDKFRVNNSGDVITTGTISGSNLSGTNTGDQTNIAGTASYASYVEYANVGNPPATVTRATLGIDTTDNVTFGSVNTTGDVIVSGSIVGGSGDLVISSTSNKILLNDPTHIDAYSSAGGFFRVGENNVADGVALVVSATNKKLLQYGLSSLNIADTYKFRAFNQSASPGTSLSSLNITAEIDAATGNSIFNNVSATGIVSGSNLSGTNTGDQVLPTRNSLGIDTDDSVTFEQIVIAKASQTGVRERLLTATVSDDSVASFFVNNGTITNGAFIPIFGGYTEATTAWSLGFSGFTSTAADAGDTSNHGIIAFNAFRASNGADPLNSTLSSIVNRKAFTFSNNGTQLMTIMPDGDTTILGTISGSNLSGTNTGDQTDIAGTASYASYVEYANVGNKPTLISGSAQIVSGLVGQKVSVTELTASNILVTNLHVTNVTSSVVYSSGSNKFGSVLTNNHQFTGSVNITGSLSVVGAITGSNLSGTNTGDQTTITGNAGTATILQTTRTIGGSNFNGSANVTSFPVPGAIGGTTPNTGVFTTLTATAGATITGSLDVTGSFSATVKSFIINHPTKPEMTLEHGVTEGPEHSVFVRGSVTGNIIHLPEYWAGLVHADSITVQLTPVGSYQQLFVKSVAIDKVEIENLIGVPHCHYYIMGTRKDIPKLTVEY